MRSLSPPAVALALGVTVLLLGTVFLGTGAETNWSRGSGSAVSGLVSPEYRTDAKGLCAQLETQRPGMNLTLFSKVCHEPSFLAAYEKFPYGFVGQSVDGLDGRVVDYQYIIEGVAPCENATVGSPTDACVEEVVWIGNATTGALSGPFYSEGLCYLFSIAAPCQGFPPHPSDLGIVVLLIVVAAALILGAAVAVGRAWPRD